MVQPDLCQKSNFLGDGTISVLGIKFFISKNVFRRNDIKVIVKINCLVIKIDFLGHLKFKYCLQRNPRMFFIRGLKRNQIITNIIAHELLY